jgi:DNA-directed RNA polymerase subunit K/omega
MEDEDYDMQDDQPLDDEEDDDIDSFSSSDDNSTTSSSEDDEETNSISSSEDEESEKPSKAPPPPTTQSLPRAAKPLISKYEWAMFIGVRAAQLERGAPTTLLDPKSYENFDVRRIASAELEQGLCPLSLIRTLPNGQKYIISAKSAVPPKL